MLCSVVSTRLITHSVVLELAMSKIYGGILNSYLAPFMTKIGSLNVDRTVIIPDFPCSIVNGQCPKDKNLSDFRTTAPLCVHPPWCPFVIRKFDCIFSTISVRLINDTSTKGAINLHWQVSLFSSFENQKEICSKLSRKKKLRNYSNNLNLFLMAFIIQQWLALGRIHKKRKSKTTKIPIGGSRKVFWARGNWHKSLVAG